jgi:threonine dehydrogenase-like Zn-dependent dehydrogenase
MRLETVSWLAQLRLADSAILALMETCPNAGVQWAAGSLAAHSMAYRLSTALIPNAQANMARIPDELNDEQVILPADIASTGFPASVRGRVRIGDSVAVFAEGPIGLCATAGAELRGAGQIFAVESNPVRLEQAIKMGAHHAININQQDSIEEILRLTARRGVDVAIEALGRQETFESALRVLRPGGTLSSLGCLLRQAGNSSGTIRRRPGRPQNRNRPLSRWQRAYAATDGARPPPSC